MAKEKEIVAGDWVAPDEAAIQLDVKDKTNPRLKLNIPANKLFIEITETDPPLLVLVVKADNPISSKGAVAHAHDMLLTHEAKASVRTALTTGVGAASRELIKGGKA